MKSTLIEQADLCEGIKSFHLRVGKTLVSIIPQLGNNCPEFSVDSFPILERADSLETFLNKPTSWGIPQLLPFPNRIRDGVFNFKGKRYAVTYPRHGFVRDKYWTVDRIGASDDECWIQSSFDTARYPEIGEQFPSTFHAQMAYRLSANTLAMEMFVQNTGENSMPLGFGIHPYFLCSEQCTIQIPARKRWELDDFLPTGKRLDVEGRFDLRQPTDLTGLVFDDIFTDLIPDDGGVVRCIINDEKRGVRTIIAFQAAMFPNVVVYTPPSPRKSICIEPMTCPTDAFNLHRRGIDCNVIVLQPQETVQFNLQISADVNQE